MERHLAPPANLHIRLAVLGVLLIPVLASYWIGVVWQLLACVLPVMLTGTYRASRLKGDNFYTRFHVAFIPVSRQQCRLPAVVALLTTYQTDDDLITLFIMGPAQWVFGKVFDFLIPAIGGPYEIWLETGKGRQILAWNGFNQANYEKNLALLQSRTGAEVRQR